MSAIERILYPAPSVIRTPLQMLRWWESRRITFNVVVGTAGIFSTGVVGLLTHLPGPLHGLPIPWPGMLAYAVMANICYSAGWVLECLQRWRLGREADDLGPVLFRRGLVFSVLLSLTPGVLAGLAWLTANR